MNAQFSVETEHLAFAVRPEKGETDSFIVYPDPDTNVLKTLWESRIRTNLWDNRYGPHLFCIFIRFFGVNSNIYAHKMLKRKS